MLNGEGMKSLTGMTRCRGMFTMRMRAEKKSNEYGNEMVDMIMRREP